MATDLLARRDDLAVFGPRRGSGRVSLGLGRRLENIERVHFYSNHSVFFFIIGQFTNTFWRSAKNGRR
jgi:hypothetical protein